MFRSVRHHSRPAILTTLAASFGLLAAQPLLALEPTPPGPSDEPPAVAQPEAAQPAQIIVKYRDTDASRAANLTSAIASAGALSVVAGTELRHVRLMSGNAQVVEVPALTSPTAGVEVPPIEDIAAAIAADPSVEYAEPDAFMQIQQAVNDPQFPQQWHYTQVGTSVNVTGGWSGATGAGVTVAVIDTGFRPHVDLAANIVGGYDFISNTTVANDGGGRDADASDPGDWVTVSETWCPVRPRDSSWHGTHVAGTVAAVTNNATGVAGVARGGRVVPVRVLGKCGGNLSDIADGMRWAAGLAVPGVPANANPAEVLNLSLGGSGACGPTYQDAVDQIVAAGATVVVAAGNSNANASNFRPANCNGVITVASTKRDGGRAYYSNFGSVVEVAAPGGETFANASDGVLSTLNSGTTTPAADIYAFYQGTSMAAPHVAGVAALLYERDPSITPAGVLATLQGTAQPFPSVTVRQCDTSNCGAGIVDAGAAVGSLLPATSVSLDWMMLLLKN